MPQYLQQPVSGVQAATLPPFGYTATWGYNSGCTPRDTLCSLGIENSLMTILLFCPNSGQFRHELNVAVHPGFKSSFPEQWGAERIVTWIHSFQHLRLLGSRPEINGLHINTFLRLSVWRCSHSTGPYLVPVSPEPSVSVERIHSLTDILPRHDEKQTQLLCCGNENPFRCSPRCRYLWISVVCGWLIYHSLGLS